MYKSVTIVACVTKSGSDKSAGGHYPSGHSAPRQCKASYGQHNHGTLAEIQVGHPPYSPNLSPCDYAIFSLKRATRGNLVTSDDDVKQ